LQVEAIKRGTVIDHIRRSVLAVDLFKLTETDQRITIGLNLPSGEMNTRSDPNRKYLLSEGQVDQLALYACKPRLTVSTAMKWWVSRAQVCRSASTMC
jgi:aspartate carbamoyltransferase regulatory subunit